MFVGHYFPAAIGAAGQRIKLWHGFVAVQLVDFLWAVFVLLGLEKLVITENFTAANHFDLTYMPYSHSLGMNIIWAALAAFGYKTVFKSGWGAALIIGGLVLSHWLLDFLVHVPDLPLWFGTDSYGLGLWNIFPLSFYLETGLITVSLFVYIWMTRPMNLWGKAAPIVLLVVLLSLQIVANFGPPAGSAAEAALTALAAFSLLTFIAAQLDRSRTFSKSS